MALGLRLATVGLAFSSPDRYLRPDSADYLALANAMTTRGVYEKDGVPELFRAPGYAFFLAMFRCRENSDLRPIVLVQAFLDAWTCVMVFLLFQRFFSDWPEKRKRLGAIVAAAFQALSVAAIAAAGLVLSETLCAFLLTLALLMLSAPPPAPTGRPSRWELLRMATLGALMAFAALVRAVAFPLGPLFVAAIWARTRRAIFPLVALAAWMAIVGAWTARNLMVADYPGFCAIGPLNLYRYNACALLARQQKRSFADCRGEIDRQLATLPRSQAEQARFCAREGRRILLADPIVYAGIHLKSDINVFLPAVGDLLQIGGVAIGAAGTLDTIHSRGLLAGVKHYFNGRWLWFYIASPLVVLLLIEYLAAAFALPAARRFGNKPLHLAAALTFLYFVLVPGPAAHPRFRVPAEPILSLYAAAGLLFALDALTPLWRRIRSIFSRKTPAR